MVERTCYHVNENCSNGHLQIVNIDAVLIYRIIMCKRELDQSTIDAVLIYIRTTARMKKQLCK